MNDSLHQMYKKQGTISFQIEDTQALLIFSQSFTKQLLKKKLLAMLFNGLEQVYGKERISLTVLGDGNPAIILKGNFK